MVDRCTRMHAASVIPDREEETFMKAIDTSWVAIHGPPKELITDCEGGIVFSERTTQYLARKGIRLHPRAPAQHARFIERRGALLRDTVHKTSS